MKERLLLELAQATAAGDESAVRTLAAETLKEHIDPAAAIEQGMQKGLLDIGRKWQDGETFITEVMLAAQAMRVGLQILEPELTKQGKALKTRGRILIGTVEGDIHDIGKMIVSSILGAEGFEVKDLGVDVPSNTFVKLASELKPDIIGLSALLTTSMPNQRNIIEALQREGLRSNVKVMVGGAPVTEQWANEIGADAYGADGMDAIKKAKELLYER